MALTFARRIARFALASQPLLEREPVAATVLRCVVDTLGCLVGARDAKPVAIARDAATAFQRVDAPSSVPSASMIGSTHRVTLEAATFVNGLAIRYLDFNDIYLAKEAVHPSDGTSVAFALAEALRIGGRRMLEAIACGYEVQCRLADTVSTRKGGWDHVLLNAISSAITAGRLLELDEDRLTQAVAIAATGNIALMQTRVGELSMWKAAAAAYAARSGLFAALHASYGLTGPAEALEGKHGLFAQVTGPAGEAAFDPGATSARLLGVHLKAYPIGYFTQGAVDAALRLRDRFHAAAISRIEVDTTAFGKLANADGPEKWQPRSRETADHSLPYGVAVALLDGEVHLRQFEPARVTADDVQSLMRRIVVRERPEFTAAYPDRMMTRVSFMQGDRCVGATTVEYPRGHPRNPLGVDDIDAKCLAMAPDASFAETIAAFWSLPSLDGAGLAALLRRALVQPPTASPPLR